MPFCSVKWCGKCSSTSSLTKDGITFHRFPKCHEMKQKWMNATKRDGNWFPGKNHVICSRHFTEDCFHFGSGNRRFLYDTAVPTLMLPCLASHQNLAEASTSSKSVTSNQKIITLATQSTSSVNATYIVIPEVQIKPDPDAPEKEEYHMELEDMEKEEANSDSEDTDRNRSSMFEGNQDFSDIAPILREMSSTLQMMANKQEDTFESFGKYVANTLRNMPERNSREMQLQIVNLLMADPIEIKPPTNAAEES